MRECTSGMHVYGCMMNAWLTDGVVSLDAIVPDHFFYLYLRYYYMYIFPYDI